MKRSNFTFLFLFALLSFAGTTWSQNPSGESTSCIGQLNVAVAADCSFEIPLLDLTVNANTMTAAAGGSLQLVGASTSSGQPISGAGAGAFYAFGALPKGTYQYSILDDAGNNICWGDIVLENKNAPTPEVNHDTIMCVEDFPNLASLNGIAGYFNNGNCGYGLYDFRALWTENGDYCGDGIWHVRDVYAKYGVDGSVREAIVWQDSILVMGIDLAGGDVTGPVEEFHLDCELLGGNYPSPAVIEAIYDDPNTRGFTNNEGAAWAWPYLRKSYMVDTPADTTYTTVYYSDTLLNHKVYVGNTSMGDSIWAVVDTAFIHKDSQMVDMITPAGMKEEFYNVPLRKEEGATNSNVCNINVKCTDMELEGQCGLNNIMRTWNLVNWCDKSVEEYTQWIIMDDYWEPYIQAPNGQYYRGNVSGGIINASTQPWTCEASVTVGVNAVDNCGELSYLWEFYQSPVIGAFSNPHGASTTVFGLTAEEIATVRCRVTDCFGNVSYYYVGIEVWDEVPPVAIAEDQINVSLTTEHGDAGGNVAKVYWSSIDAGSHDAGCGDVNYCVVRPEDEEIPLYDCLGRFIGYEPVTCGAHTRWVARGLCTKDGWIEYDRFGNLIDPVQVTVCGEFVKFCCEDAGENDVVLRVWDNATQGPNYSESWTVVNVEDKAGWTVNCVRELYVDCDDFDYSAPNVPYPDVWNYTCQELDITWDTPQGPDGCGGSEQITYYVNGEPYCTTTIFYNQTSQFNPYEIKWPVHYDGEGAYGVVRECEVVNSRGNTGIVERYDYIAHEDAFECEGGEIAEPVWCNASCALVGSNYEDVEVEAADACKKIIRRWTIIDWCTWEPNGENTGFYNDPPDDENDNPYKEGFEIVDDEWLDALGNEGTWLTDTNIEGYYDSSNRWVPAPACETCEKPSGAAAHRYYRYAYVDWDGYYTYDQVIKIADKTDPTIAVEEEVQVDVVDGNGAKLPADYDADEAFEDCVGSDVVTASAADLCGESELDAETIVWWIELSKGGRTVTTKSAVGAEATMSTGTGAPGDVHLITWIAKDGCGNQATAYTTVTFVDTKNPTPVCLQDISTATMNVAGSTVAIWASDYDLGSFDNCSDVDVYFKNANGDAVTSLTFGCADNDDADYQITNGIVQTFELELYVADASGNEDFCMVTLKVSDNEPGICDDVDGGAAALIAGEVRTELGDMVESAQVSLNKANTDITSVEGKYAFANTPMYNAYEVTSKKDDDYLNGVTTLDLVLIQKHVLGIEALDSPYKVIAADINSDAKISGADLVDLRKLILGVYTELPSNDSWRFVDAAQSFDDVANPFPFTEALTVNLDAEALNQDFIAAKIGDVSGNAIANSLIAAGTRSAGTLNLEISDAAVAAGNTVSVAVTAANFSEIAAYQFTMDVAGLEFTGVEAGAINVTADNFAALDANTVTTAWFNAEAVSTSDVLFTMNFTATADVNLSEALAVSSRVTQAAAYNANAEKLDINVAYNGVAASEFALYQNEPNPFDQTTTVAFELAQAGAATLTVFDVTGKTVSVVKGDFNKGYNTITLDKSDLNASGVLYYQLESGSFTATKKMVVIE